ncbi:transposase domain protein [Klebsiella pneumoniae]|nr:transposase domain protein [Klebsiella pneumoniae]
MGRSESAIVKGRKISLVHWAWSLTQWYCGTLFICRKP